MTNFNKNILALTTLLSGLVSFSALAASNGELGSPSIGSTQISVTKDEAVMLSDVHDINLGIHSAVVSNLVGGDEMCVYSSSEKYSVMASTLSGGFNLLGPGSIPFSLEWNGEPLAHGLQSQTMFGDSVNFNCNGSQNASLLAIVQATDFNAAESGFYSEIVTLTIEPQ